MDFRKAINETTGTANDTLAKALVRAEEEGWRGVVVLAICDDGCRFLKSSALNDMETLGVLRWGGLIAESQSLQDLHDHPEGV